MAMASQSALLVSTSPPLLRASWSGLKPAFSIRTTSSRHLWRSNGGQSIDNNSRAGGRNGIRRRRRRPLVVAGFLPVDPWAPNTDQQSIASSLFAASLFPYLGFLYHLTKSKTAPKLTLFGFYFLLAFVGATSNDSALWIVSFCPISRVFFCCNGGFISSCSYLGG